VAGWPWMVVGQPAHVASAPKLCPKGVVVELKRGIVEGKGGKEERREKVADQECLAST
jgi:ribosomal protein L6P/L9E